MTTYRVYQLASELSFDRAELVDKINSLDLGFTVSNYMSTLTDDEVDALRDALHREKVAKVEETRLNDAGTVIRRRSKSRRGGDAEPAEVAPAPAAAPTPAVRKNPRSNGRVVTASAAPEVQAPAVEPEAPVVEPTPSVSAADADREAAAAAAQREAEAVRARQEEARLAAAEAAAEAEAKAAREAAEALAQQAAAVAPQPPAPAPAPPPSPRRHVDPGFVPAVIVSRPEVRPVVQPPARPAQPSRDRDYQSGRPGQGQGPRPAQGQAPAGRDNRDGRDGRDNRDSRDVRPAREVRDVRDNRDSRPAPARSPDRGAPPARPEAGGDRRGPVDSRSRPAPTDSRTRPAPTDSRTRPAPARPGPARPGPGPGVGRPAGRFADEEEGFNDEEDDSVDEFGDGGIFDGPPDLTAAARRGKRPTPAAPVAKIMGRIDPTILKDRLAAEGKVFDVVDKGGAKAVRAPRTAVDDATRDAERRRRGAEKTSRRSVSREQLYDDDNRRLRQLARNKKGARKKPARTQITKAAAHKRVVKVNEAIILSNLAKEMGVKASDLIRDLLGMGEMYTINQAVDFDVAGILADKYGYTVENVAFDVGDYVDSSEDVAGDLVNRPPVVTVMGHVDHGKTSLLDAIRKTSIAIDEAGGITQHIGAYQAVTDGGVPITFLDTPGHEAFTALRMRGAQATDIVILVVAADDGVMPQTVEAINHSRAAGVPIIVAINKIDKPGANPDRVKQALTEYNLIPEEWGGETMFIEVSALLNQNIDGLLESVLVLSEVLELQVNPARQAMGTVIESRLDTGRGPVATLLVQKGTLNAGDIAVVGEFFGRIRAMFDWKGHDVTTAPPSTPVEITGLSGVPSAGENFFVVEDEKTAREITSHVREENREKAIMNRAKRPGGLAELTRMLQSGALKELKVIVKGDVQGSVEAVEGLLSKLGNAEAQVRIIHAAVGRITENDVNLAASSPDGAIIVGFNVRPETRGAALAEERGIEIITHSVIYEIEEVVKSALEGLLSPILTEKTVGRIEIRETFSVPKVGMVAGCMVLDGYVKRGAMCRVVRDSRIVYTSRISTLKRFKDDAREVKQGFECGLTVDNFNDIKIGDIVEVYEIESRAATLN